MSRSPETPPVVLTVAGTDSGGGAGIAADLATYAALGVHGTAVVTAVTAQDTTGVRAIHPVPLEVVAAQLDAVLGDLAPAVVKTGMLGAAEVARLVADQVARLRPVTSTGTRRTTSLVVDPVLRATTGATLAGPELVEAYLSALLPVATVVTPNAAEARVLLGLAPDDATPSAELAVSLADKLDGPHVVLTGGPDPAHGTRAGRCTDWLARPGQQSVGIEHPAVVTTNDHGTGCTHASALAAHLAHGDDLETAARKAATFVTRQLATSRQWQLGRGRGPIAHTHSHIHPPTNHSAPITEEIA